MDRDGIPNRMDGDGVQNSRDPKPNAPNANMGRDMDRNGVRNRNDDSPNNRWDD